MPVVRDRDAEIALFQYKAGSAVALTAEHDADRAVPEVHLIVVLAADFGSVNPESLFLEFVDRIADVGHLGDRHMFKCACRCLLYRSSHAAGAPLGDNDAVHAEHIRAADDRTEVVRVFDIIQ